MGTPESIKPQEAEHLLEEAQNLLMATCHVAEEKVVEARKRLVNAVFLAREEKLSFEMTAFKEGINSAPTILSELEQLTTGYKEKVQQLVEVVDAGTTPIARRVLRRKVQDALQKIHQSVLNAENKVAHAGEIVAFMDPAYQEMPKWVSLGATEFQIKPNPIIGKALGRRLREEKRRLAFVTKKQTDTERKLREADQKILELRKQLDQQVLESNAAKIAFHEKSQELEKNKDKIQAIEKQNSVLEDNILKTSEKVALATHELEVIRRTSTRENNLETADANLLHLKNSLIALEGFIEEFTKRPTFANARIMLIQTSGIWSFYSTGCSGSSRRFDPHKPVPKEIKTLFLKVQKKLEEKCTDPKAAEFSDPLRRVTKLNKEVEQFPPSWVLLGVINSKTLKQLLTP